MNSIKENLIARETWALSKNNDDIFIREFLYSKISPKNARRVLATVFPNGSACDRIKEKMNNKNSTSQEEYESILNEIGKEVYQKALESGNVDNHFSYSFLIK